MIDKNNFAAAIRAADGVEQPGEAPLSGLFCVFVRGAARFIEPLARLRLGGCFMRLARFARGRI